MFEVRVCALDEMPRYAKWATHVVSLVDPGVEVPKLPDRQHLVLHFHDTPTPMPGMKMPTRQDLEQVLRFTRGLGADDHLLIHCHAGISRSTAIAVGVLIQHGRTPQAAYDEVRRIRPQAWPNRAIIRYIDYRFRLRGELMEIDEEQQHRQMRSMTLRPAKTAGQYIYAHESGEMRRLIGLIEDLDQ